MLELILQKIGIAIPPDILLEKAPIPEKKDLMEAMQKQQQQQAQMQQQQQELEMAEIKSRINLAEARATADYGLGVERVSRIEENKSLSVERRAEAIRDLEAASLDRVKAIKELQGIDIQHLQNLVNILNSIQSQEVEKVQGETKIKGGQNVKPM